MAKLTKNNYKKFSRRNLLPNTDGSKPSGAAADRIFRQNNELLERFHRDYDSLQTVRENKERCKRYLYGDQLSDLVDDPDGCGKITERKLIEKKGMVPMELNIIAEPITNIIGLYARSHMQPMVVARDRDEQKLGEMMTMAMEYAYQNQNIQKKNVREWGELLMGAVAAFRVGYERDEERQMSDVKVNQADLNRMGWDNNTSGMYFENITRIGYLHDLPLGVICSKWANSPNEVAQIKQIYKDCQNRFDSQQQHQPDSRMTHIDFFRPLNPENCRVIEIWTKELIEEGYLFHDIKKGIEIITDNRYDPDIIAENNRRVLEMVEAGGAAEDASQIEYEGFKSHNVWVVRYLTPDGYVLHEEVSPYWHGSHPFAIGAYPLVDGEAHSLIERLINVQRVYNSTFTSNRYIRMNQAKGGLLVNKKILDRNKIPLSEVGRVYTDPTAVLAAEWEDGEHLFVPFTDKNAAAAAIDNITPGQCLELMDKMAGNSGAIRGETPKAGTPSSLYAQMTENSNNNIADMMDWYNGLIQIRDYKVMMTIQQFYTEVRHMEIAGKKYSEQSKWYDPEKVRKSKFDLSLVESQSTGLYRQMAEDALLFMLQNGMIDGQMYLENTTLPFADNMLEALKRRQEEAEQAQNNIPPQGAQGALPPQPGIQPGAQPAAAGQMPTSNVNPPMG